MYPALNGVHPLLRNSLSFPRSNVTVFLPKNRTATSAHYRPVTWIIVVQDSVTRSDDARFRLPRGIQKNKIMPPMLHNDVLNNGEGHASHLTRFIPCPIRLPAQPELVYLTSRLWLVFHHIRDLIRSRVRHHTACPRQCLIRNFNVQHSRPPCEAT